MFNIEKYDGYISTNSLDVSQILNIDISNLDGYINGFSGQLELIIAGYRIGVSAIDVSIRALVTLKKQGPYLTYSINEVDGYNSAVIGTAGIFGSLSYSVINSANFSIRLTPDTTAPTQWHCIATLIMFNVES